MRPTHGLIIFLILILLILTPLTFLKKLPLSKRFSQGIPITLYAKSERKIYSTNLENYLVGVVAAEMPANFALEALKAQAVAARTIAVQRLRRYGGRGTEHPGVDFTDDPSENQAWESTAQLKTKWGIDNFNTYYQKIRLAVEQTAGIIMIYQNRPIDAVFHSTCSVGTADAREVWHHSVPYLQSTNCGFDYDSPHYQSSVNIRWTELSEMFGIPSGTSFQIRIRQRSSLGRVLWISVGNKLYSGEDFRKMLHLNSTLFSCSLNKSRVFFKVIGYGHGVGMCQYGAEGMAKHGWNYHQILSHYYRGIKFYKIK